MEQPEQKSCQNCRYYIQYYIKDYLRYRTIDKGHCSKRRCVKPALCERWETIDIKHKEDDKSLKNTLLSISRRLSNIAEYISDSDTFSK